ncbi:hypothetical protein ABPG77_006281, partial [Micractinium sp. CCAP 211/92]
AGGGARGCAGGGARACAHGAPGSGCAQAAPESKRRNAGHRKGGSGKLGGS